MKLLLILSLFLTAVGCSHIYKHYDYEAGVTSAHGGTVTVILNGHYTTESESPSVTRVGSPYCVVVYWHSQDLNLASKPIETHIGLMTQESGLQLIINQVKSGIIQTPNKRFQPDVENEAYFNAAACELVIEKHEPVIIEGTIIINGKSIEYKATLMPNYWQERRNDTFDAMMSV